MSDSAVSHSQKQLIKLVKFLASLANVTLTEDEIVTYAEQLKEIIDFVTQVKNMDTADVLPKYHSVDVKNVFQPEHVSTRSFTQEEALANAQNAQDGYFVVDKIIDKS